MKCIPGIILFDGSVLQGIVATALAGTITSRTFKRIATRSFVWLSSSFIWLVAWSVVGSAVCLFKLAVFGIRGLLWWHFFYLPRILMVAKLAIVATLGGLALELFDLCFLAVSLLHKVKITWQVISTLVARVYAPWDVWISPFLHNFKSLSAVPQVLLGDELSSILGAAKALMHHYGRHLGEVLGRVAESFFEDYIPRVQGALLFEGSQATSQQLPGKKEDRSLGDSSLFRCVFDWLDRATDVRWYYPKLRRWKVRNALPKGSHGSQLYDGVGVHGL